MKKRGVFLDRDGVLTDLVINPKTHEYEAAQKAEDLRLLPDVLSPLHYLLNLGFFLFIVSNQPDYAKGKTMLNLNSAI